jgi:hypothetical protein
MSNKFYVASGILSFGNRFCSATIAKSQKDVKSQLQKALPNGMKIQELLSVDELSENIAPLNSAKAVAVAWENQELLTVSFVFQNINPNIRKDLINDLNAVIAKYRL